MKKRLVIVISIFTVVCLMLLSIIYIEAKVLSGVRAYVRGEGLYAKGQKDAVIALLRYTRTRDHADFLMFQKMLEVPIGDRLARESLQQTPPDISKATEGFFRGQNDLSDIPMMINLFLYFNKVPFMEKAISIWTEGDKQIRNLVEEGYKLKSSVENGNEEKITKHLIAIDRLNQKLAQLELDFSLTIGDGAKLVTSILIGTSFSLSALIFIVLFFYMRSIVRKVVKTEQELKDRQDQLKHEIDTKNRFFSIIAHDLNTPYSQLLGYTEAIASNVSDFTKEEIVDAVKRVNAAAKRVFILQKNLLQWSQAQFVNDAISISDFSIDQIAKEKILIFEMIAQDKNITIINEIEEYHVLADVDMVRTVLRNLISNAIKFTPSGGTITLRSKKQNNMLEVAVIDDGVGMTDQQRKSLFSLDHISSTAGTNGEKGTGLGTALCKEMVERNSGEIWVDESTKKGTTIRFTLPLA